MRIVFAGTPDFAAKALKAIVAAGHEVVLVLTQPDRPAGRGLHLQPSAVKELALQHQLPILQPKSLRLTSSNNELAQEAQQAHEILRASDYDVMVVAAYGLILPESILTIPPYGCLNIHASKLPRWRGAAPIHRAILAGDTDTGITIMQMDVGLDTGAMLSMRTIPISAHDTQASLHDKLAELGGKMIVDVLQQLPLGTLKATPQPQEGVTYANKISKEEAALDFTQSVTIVERQIRAFNPFPGAFGIIDGMTLKIWEAEITPSPLKSTPGQLIMLEDQRLLVVCKEGALHLKTIQRPGGKKLAASEFLKGYSVKDGCCFNLPVA